MYIWSGLKSEGDVKVEVKCDIRVSDVCKRLSTIGRLQVWATIQETSNGFYTDNAIEYTNEKVETNISS